MILHTQYVCVKLLAKSRLTLAISCEGRTTLPWFTMTGPTMMLSYASNRPSSAASRCWATPLFLPQGMCTTVGRWNRLPSSPMMNRPGMLFEPSRATTMPSSAFGPRTLNLRLTVTSCPG